MSMVAKGDAFRDLIVELLDAAGIKSIPEVRRRFKKVDIEAEIEEMFSGQATLLIEAKDYSSNLPKSECTAFVAEYGALTRQNQKTKAWLISRGPISPDARELVDANDNMKCFTYAELQRWTLNLRGYTADIISQFENERIDEYFIPPRTLNGEDLSVFVDNWIADGIAHPLAITGGYGVGKTTFAKHLSARLGRLSLEKSSARIPILIPLGEVSDEQSIEGLVGKVLASTYRAPGYHYKLFEKLNQLGHFVLIFDGFDEMKHGMTPRGFERNVTEFMSLDKGNSRIIILGRDTAFHTEQEFTSIIEGKRRTLGGTLVSDRSRRSFRPIGLLGFTIAEAKQFIKSYFPIAVEDATRRDAKAADQAWIAKRSQELLGGSVDELLDRPVHAQMLCEIATQPDILIEYISRYQLYDLFIHYLLDREVAKRGRSSHFDIDTRRVFNSSLAWWLWERGGASTTTFADIPEEIFTIAAKGIPHELDDISLRRELVAGCLINKNGDTIFFSHRSIQEFLVAEHLISTDFSTKYDGLQKDATEQFFRSISNLTPEIVNFIVSGVHNRRILHEQILSWLNRFNQVSTSSPISIIALDLFTQILCAARIGLDPLAGPWAFLLENFTRNGKAEFSISNAQVDAAKSLLIPALAKDLSFSSVAVFYWCRCIRRDSGNAGRLTALLLARLSTPGALEAALRAVKNRAPGSPSEIVIEYRLQPLLWVLLRYVTVEHSGTGDVRLKLDLDKIISWASTVSGLQLNEEVLVGTVQSFRSASLCSLGEVCDAVQEIGYTSGDASTVKRYFSNNEFRQRLRASNIAPRPAF